ncbi:MAG: electron transport complex subunit E [Candidatus Hydrogenedentota bacterium]
MINEPQEPSMDVFLRGLWKENPVFVMVLGMCPTLAVSNSVINALSMGLAATFVLVASCVLVSIMRKWIPKQVRIATYIVIIATFVTMVDFAIQAISLEVYNALGAFIALIVVNCIILGRAEAFASKNGPVRSALDALGMGLGFTLALLCLGVVREILGSGTLLGYPVVGKHFEPWAIMILPPGGFLTLGTWLLIFNWWRTRKDRHADASTGGHAA